MRDLYTRVQRLNESHHVPWARIAWIAGMSPSNLSAYMCGRLRPSLATRVRLDGAVEAYVFAHRAGYDESAAALRAQIRERYGDKERFIQEYRQWRKDSSVSLKRLARISGFAASHISEWMNGHREPTLETMIVLDETRELINKNAR